jgi:uncharacterized protein HemX
MRSQPSPAFVLIPGLLATLALQGCAQKATEQPLEHTVRKVPAETAESPPEPRAEEASGAVAQAKADFERMLNRKLEGLDEEIRELQRKVATLQETAKAKWTEKVAALEAKRREAGAKLEEVGAATGEAWEHLRDGAERAWDELEQAVKKAVAEF